MSPAPPRASAGWWVIARRELLERVRSRWFIVVTLIGPLLLVAAMAVPVLIAQAGEALRARVVIVDQGSGIGPALGADLTGLGWEVTTAPADTENALLLSQIADERIDGFLRLPADLVQGEGRAIYQGDNAANQGAMGLLADRLTRVVSGARLSARGIAAADIQAALRPPAFETRHTTGRAGGSAGALVFIVGYLVVMLLYVAIVVYAVNVMRAVVLEKSNRVVEILLAAAKPRALMVGKIVGVGSAGLIQVGVWALALLVLGAFQSDLLGPAAAGLPPIDVFTVMVILVYFVLGFFFYASLYAAIGAMVSSEQEAQQVQGPIVMLLIVPIASMQLVTNDPRGVAAEVLTQVPLSSPFLMPMRHLLEGASPLSLVVSMAILALSTWFLSVLAARVFRVGILMTGKRPTLRELWRWLRYP